MTGQCVRHRVEAVFLRQIPGRHEANQPRLVESHLEATGVNLDNLPIQGVIAQVGRELALEGVLHFVHGLA